MAGKKVVLITGCSDGGLGSALAIAFHKAGYRVIATARNLSKLSETRALGIEEIQLDVLSGESLAQCAKTLEALTGGRLDVLVNNAGAGYNMPMVDVDLNEVRKLFELNTFSLLTVTQAFLPLLLKTTEAKLVNNISIAAYGALPFQGTYNASKSAANAINENMRLELAPFGIKVIALMTGSVKSRFFDNLEQINLPEDSIYRVAPGGLQLMSDPGAILSKGAPDADVWSAQVVKDLQRDSPPHQIWRGASATAVRIAALLPVGTIDSQLMKMSQLDKVAKAVNESKWNKDRDDTFHGIEP